MNLIAQIEAEQIAALGKTIPDFKAGDTIRVGYKVTEGTRSRVQAYEGVCIARKNGKGIAGSFTVRKIPLAKAWNACSRCIRPISTASKLSVAARSVAPSCITCAHVAVNPHASPKSPTTRRLPALRHRTGSMKKEFTPITTSSTSSSLTVRSCR